MTLFNIPILFILNFHLLFHLHFILNFILFIHLQFIIFMVFYILKQKLVKMCYSFSVFLCLDPYLCKIHHLFYFNEICAIYIVCSILPQKRFSYVEYLMQIFLASMNLFSSNYPFYFYFHCCVHHSNFLLITYQNLDFQNCQNFQYFDFLFK